MKLPSNTIFAYPRKSEYPGAFNPTVEKVIKEIIEGKYCVHLFSGSSTLGKIRVDIKHKNANCNENVYDFCQEYNVIVGKPINQKSILLMDPDYAVQRKHLKLKPHGINSSIGGNVLAHKILNDFISNIGFDEILILELASPTFKNYDEIFWWRVKTGGWQHNRTLTWYRRKSERL